MKGGAFGGNRGLSPVPLGKGIIPLDHMHLCDLIICFFFSNLRHFFTCFMPFFTCLFISGEDKISQLSKDYWASV